MERSTDGSTYTPVATLPADATSYDDTSVTPLQQYWYRVTGIAASGAAGPSTTTSDVDPADETGLGPAVTTPLPNVVLNPGWAHWVDMDDYFSYGGVTKTHYTVTGDTNPGLFERIPAFFSGLPDRLYFETDPNSSGGTADITIDYTAQTGAYAEATFTVTVLSPPPVLNRTGPRGSTITRPMAQTRLPSPAERSSSLPPTRFRVTRT